MRPISHIDRDTAQSLAGVLFDLDDTLLDAGRLSKEAYISLFRLREAGLILIAVTGRPSGWGEILARQWPVQGFVTENGPISVINVGGAVRIIDEADAKTRAERRSQLTALVELIVKSFPDLTPASDISMRRSDFTFDIGEYRHVPNDVVVRAMNFARAHGALTVRSSVHLHISFDGSDKASGTLRLLYQQLAFDVTEARRLFAFIGDSENDEAGFAAFHTSVAVANLRGRPTVSPQFLTEAERGLGFAEFAERLAELRR
jgi:HAD superfamily hydrolase (TIGR01484 family)